MRRVFAVTLLTMVMAFGMRPHGQGYTSTNPGMYWVPPTACVSSVSGNSTGTNGLTSAGAYLVNQASTSASGTNTHTYVCNIAPLGIKTTGTGYAILDAVFVFGDTGSVGLGTQVATLASGTMNTSIVFAYVDYPTPSGSETASALTATRADSGTLVITPAVASFPTSTITAGRFFTVKFTPATPIAWKTDLRNLFLTVTLQATATSATITQAAGVLVHLTSR